MEVFKIRKEKNSKLREMIKEYGVKNLEDVNNFVKMLTSETIQEILDAERTEELGYSKYDYKNKETKNSRNGHYKKTVQSSQGEISLDIPRDRNGDYEAQIVKKHEFDISSLEDKILFMYSQGTSTRDIEKTMNELYGINVDDSKISRITDKILPLISKWQKRPLQELYALLMLDAIYYSFREDGVVVKKAAYVCIGTDLEGRKDVLGIYLSNSESSKFWLQILNSLKSRGVKDILIASVDGLSGFAEAINSAFPKTEVQKCIVHQIRNSVKYVSYKDLKEFTTDLKPIYKAPDKDSALISLDNFEEKWGSKYPLAIKSWRKNWEELSVMFKYSPEIRKIIYTTNAIENFNKQLRKVTKTKGAFVSDDSLMKILYLATMQISEKWTMPIRNWGIILNELLIYFDDRININF